MYFQTSPTGVARVFIFADYALNLDMAAGNFGGSMLTFRQETR